jgi:DNA-binding CsgD family transcriptional regulator
MLDAASTGPTVLTHLLAPTAARVAAMLGSDAEAADTVAQALASATARGIVLGTDELWLLHTEYAVDRGDPAAAGDGLTRLARIAERMDTGPSRLRHLLGRVAVERDVAAASQAVALARTLDQPFVLADTLAWVVRRGAHPAGQLREAYEIFGQLGAVLHRGWIRTLMREHDIPVPRRAATVAENERLLATLVAEGLTNRQLAAALQASEKSVEGRLTRLFSRGGYRSRVELATALLAGDHQFD